MASSNIVHTEIQPVVEYRRMRQGRRRRRRREGEEVAARRIGRQSDTNMLNLRHKRENTNIFFSIHSPLKLTEFQAQKAKRQYAQLTRKIKVILMNRGGRTVESRDTYLKMNSRDTYLEIPQASSDLSDNRLSIPMAFLGFKELMVKPQKTDRGGFKAKMQIAVASSPEDHRTAVWVVVMEERWEKEREERWCAGLGKVWAKPAKEQEKYTGFRSLY